NIWNAGAAFFTGKVDGVDVGHFSGTAVQLGSAVANLWDAEVQVLTLGHGNLRDAGTFFSGWGDNVGFGLPSIINTWTGAISNVDCNSNLYLGGQVAGFINQVFMMSECFIADEATVVSTKWGPRVARFIIGDGTEANFSKTLLKGMSFNLPRWEAWWRQALYFGVTAKLLLGLGYEPGEMLHKTMERTSGHDPCE